MINLPEGTKQWLKFIGVGIVCALLIWANISIWTEVALNG